MLLIPVMISGGDGDHVELRNPWQRAWAQFRTSQSPIDYVRVSGLGVDPLLVNAAQTRRPGRGWWRNIVDLYGAPNMLVAEVKLDRLYPGGPAGAIVHRPARARRRLLGSFELTAADSADIPRDDGRGRRSGWTQLFTQALAAGVLVRDPTLIMPPPPPPVEERGRERRAQASRATDPVVHLGDRRATLAQRIAQIRRAIGGSRSEDWSAERCRRHAARRRPRACAFTVVGGQHFGGVRASAGGARMVGRVCWRPRCASPRAAPGAAATARRQRPTQ